MRRALTLMLTLALAASGLARAEVSPAALRALRRGDLPRAVTLLRQEVHADPADADAVLSLGQALARLDRRDEAAEALRRAIALRPDRWTGYAALADLLSEDPRRRELRDETLQLLRTGLEKVANDPVGRVNLTISTAIFERSVGRTRAARARLNGLGGTRQTTEQRRRVLYLMDQIQLEERALTLIDWPEPKVPETASQALLRAERLLLSGDADAARLEAERHKMLYPGWRGARWLLARALEASGRADLAERELTVLVHLSPSHGAAWRRLGRILAAHGGAGDQERADEALRHALAIEPAYFDLWLLRARVALRRNRSDEAERWLRRYLIDSPEHEGDAEVALLRAQIAQARDKPEQKPRSHSAEPPTEQARLFYREALDWINLGDPAELALPRLEAALEESPGYLEAAVTAFSLTEQMPERTVKALWQDGEAMLDLARRVRALKNNAVTRQLVRPWLDQAVALGVVAARFERGLLRIEDHDRAGGIVDLLHYVAADPNPRELDEAREALSSSPETGRDATRILARVKLLSDYPKGALEALGGRCDRAAPPERLQGLGLVHEWSGDLLAAVGCYREALRRSPTAAEPLERLAGIGARAPLPLCAGLEPELAQAAGRGVAPAEWALARLHLLRGEDERALFRLERFLRGAGAEDPHVPAARAAQERILKGRDRARRQLLIRSWLLGGGCLAGVLALVLWFLRGAPLARALTRRPALFPEVARAIGELRHDVLKHRTSVLGLAEGAGQLDEVARMLWEPRRASELIAVAYEDLRQAARGRGVTLRRLSREPVFGPLYRDLRRAEVLVRRPALGPSGTAALRRIDDRLRRLHSERLGALLRLAPRTRLDAGLLAGWIRSVEGELRLHDGQWTSPVLHLGGLDLEFPVERGALQTIFTNLLRNAQIAASAPGGGGGVIVRAGQERDATGRRVITLLLGDSAPQGLTLEAIERRESGRGLAIVRDLVHEWRGHLVIRPEAPPWSKGVGACFPV